MLQLWYGTTVATSHWIYSCTVALARSSGTVPLLQHSWTPKKAT